MIQKALMDSFGIACSIEDISIKGLPVFMKDGRRFHRLSFEGFDFLVVDILSVDRFGIIALKKQELQYMQKTGMNVVFSFSCVTKTQRDALVSKGISFICLPDQIFLPALGIALRNHFSQKKVIDADKMMPTTQSLFLYLLYQKNRFISKSEAANKLALTKTSITRASDQLKAMGLIKEVSEGRNRYMQPVSSGKEYFGMAKQFLINPVQKTIYVAASKDMKNLPEAGETALSKQSMLSEPSIKCFAAYKGDAAVQEYSVVEPRWMPDQPCYRIELWKYNPSLFTQGKCVDIVSLAMSLNSNEDERVQGELEECLENYKW